MSQKMQQLLDLIVNEEMDKANELFHEIVVEKSREIYENLIAEEAEEDEEEMDESAEEDEEEDESVEEGFGMEDEAEDHLGGDPADDMVGDVSDHDTMGDEEGGDMGGEEGGAPATKDDVQDLEDALAELKAEFEALMGGSAGGEDDGEEEFGGEDDGEEEFGDEEDSEDDEEDDEEDFEENMGVVREYRERVGNDWQGSSMKAQGKSIGANTGDSYPAPSEGKSPVSSGSGKPTTGANAKNIAQASTGEGTNVGTSTNADKGSRGLVGATKGEFTKGVEKNISNSSKSGMKDGAALDKVAKGHGAEKKGSGPAPVGAGTGDKAGQTSVAPIKPFLKKL